MTSELPLISVICPTKNRRQFMVQVLRYFEAQDYPNKEFIALDEYQTFGQMTAVATNISPNITYVTMTGDTSSLTIGAKRNMLCHFAHGEIICFQDDDDWYGPQRLSQQVEPLLSGEYDVSGMVMSLLLRTRDMSLWHPSERVHDALFGSGVRCGTLMFWRHFWQDGLRFENINRGEDARYLQGLLARDARLAKVVDPASYICVRHGSNVSDEIDGIEPPEWKQVPLEAYLSKDEMSFYRSLAVPLTV